MKIEPFLDEKWFLLDHEQKSFKMKPDMHSFLVSFCPWPFYGHFVVLFWSECGRFLAQNEPRDF